MVEAVKHPPLPWSVFDHYCGRDPETAGEYAETRLIGTGQFDTIAEVRMGHDELAGDVDAISEFIVRACNAHYELLETLRYVLESLGAPVPISRRHVARKIADAIAQAEGRDHG